MLPSGTGKARQTSYLSLIKRYLDATEKEKMAQINKRDTNGGKTPSYATLQKCQAGQNANYRNKSFWLPKSSPNTITYSYSREVDSPLSNQFSLIFQHTTYPYSKSQVRQQIFQRSLFKISLGKAQTTTKKLIIVKRYNPHSYMEDLASIISS